MPHESVQNEPFPILQIDNGYDPAETRALVERTLAEDYHFSLPEAQKHAIDLMRHRNADIASGSVLLEPRPDGSYDTAYQPDGDRPPEVILAIAEAARPEGMTPCDRDIARRALKEIALRPKMTDN
jgi:hypothetical protein